ncbi:MAG TPA: hypothetical protein DGG95_07170 [Cytophagales bacterium]|jgi:outer membrane protein OmpA-like peptidoglycan-associated protein|nr:hypothetical protein [Cytophagales bacterium]
MKRISISLFVFFSLTHSFAQQASTLANGYYVVVSTFLRNQGKDAKAYSDLLNQRGFHTGYGLEESKGFVYVYLANFDFTQFRQSIDRMKQARATENFTTAWVLKIKDGKQIKEDTPIDLPADTAKKVITSKETSTPSIVTEFIPNPTPKPVFKPQHLGNTPVFLSIIKKSNKQVMNGIIKVSDPDNNRSLGTVKANAYFNMSDPRSKSGNIVLTASAFGYNDAVQTLNYKQTERDTLKEDVTLFGNFFMVTFEMERASKGANFILSGLNFFNEAAIMVPSSQGQLNEVLDMLKEKPSMRIRLEGYTNGNSRGNIITMGPSKNYFSITSKDQKTEKGSAKDLSQARADAAKSWLIDQGIAADRIEAVGMGGDKPIYDSKSTLARKNARLELTVLE